MTSVIIMGKSAMGMLGRICTICKLSFNEPEQIQYIFSLNVTKLG